MPFINLKTNVAITETNALTLKKSLGEKISTLPGKTESWLMLNFEENQKMFFRGEDSPCCMVEVKVYGTKLDEDKSNRLTSEITELVHKTLKIDSSRIYVAYFMTDKWGYAGENF